jgi:predicted AAA+ superfamily ATPase
MTTTTQSADTAVAFVPVGKTATATAEIAAKVSPWPEWAREIVVEDKATFDAASELLKGIKALEAEVKRVFDPLAEAANKAHKQITGERAAQLRPLAEAESTIKQKVSEFLLAQERIQRAEQARLQAIAEAEAAAALEAQVKQAEANGATAKEIEAIIDDAPPAPMVVHVAPAVETKGTGISQRLEWVADVENLGLLIQAAAKTPHLRKLLKVDEVALRAMTRAMGSEMRSVPGLKVYQRAIVSARK